MRMRKAGDDERGCGFLRFLSPSRSSLFLLCAAKKVDSAGTHSTLRMPVGSRLADANVLSVPLYASASVRCWNGRLLSAVPVVGQGADTRCFPHSPWVFAGNRSSSWFRSQFIKLVKILDTNNFFISPEIEKSCGYICLQKNLMKFINML